MSNRDRVSSSPWWVCTCSIGGTCPWGSSRSGLKRIPYPFPGGRSIVTGPKRIRFEPALAISGP